MCEKTMHVSLNPESAALIERIMASGLYESPDEVMTRALEFLHEVQQQQEERLDTELQKGIEQIKNRQTRPYNLSNIKAKASDNIRKGIKVSPDSAALPPSDH